MVKLRIQDNRSESKGHEGEVLSCAYTPDGAYVLSAGWDGHLRLWEVSTGQVITARGVSAKPLSACAVSPSGRQWAAGSMEGMLTFLDSHTHLVQSNQVAHTRPISDIRYSPDGQWAATTSWDRSVTLRPLARDRDSRTVTGHNDIVAGCRFFADGGTLMTFSHDGMVKLWGVGADRELASLSDHKDRVVAGDVSPDGAWMATADRDGMVILWDVPKRRRMRSLRLASEPRGCFFLPDVQTLVTVDACGRVLSFAMPNLEVQAQLSTGTATQCATLCPAGTQLALGGENGQIQLIAIEGMEAAPLVVTAAQRTQTTATRLQRLFGRSQLTRVFECLCPRCGNDFELFDRLPGEPTPCPRCQRPLRFNATTRPALARAATEKT